MGNLPNRLRAIWLNPELAKKNPRCLENIVIGAVTYLLERTHAERFVELVDRHLSDWPARKFELNDATLAAEDRSTQ